MRAHRKYCRYWASCDHCNMSFITVDPRRLAIMILEHRRGHHPDLFPRAVPYDDTVVPR